MVNSQIQAKFKPGELSIYDRQSGFDFADKSIMGTHTLCITNQGRVIAHDTGGIFGSEQVIEYDSAIHVTFLSFGIQLHSTTYSQLTFDFTLTVDEFIKLNSSIPKHKISYDQSVNPKCYVQWGSSSYTFMDFKWNDQGIHLDQQFLPFFRMEKASYTVTGKMTIQGHFHGEDQCEYATVHLFHPKLELLKQIQESWQGASKLYDLVGSPISLCPVQIQHQANGAKATSQLTFVFQQDRVSIVNEKTHQILQTFSMKDRWYFQASQPTAVVLRDGIPYLFEFKTSYAQKCYRSKFNSKVYQLYGAYPVWGRIMDKDFAGDPVYLLVDQDDFYFLLSNRLRLVKIPLHALSFFHKEGKSFLLHTVKKEICLVDSLSASDQQRIEQKMKVEENPVIGYTNENQPFFIEQDEKGLVLRQSQTQEIYFFDHRHIKEITVAASGEHFSRVKVALANRIEALHVPSSLISLLIHQTYYYAKVPMLQQVTSDQMYVSWTRQVNDHLLYYFFGQLFLLQKGIEEIRHSVKNNNDRNMDLINYMYYAIQEQKRRLDAVAIYFPASLHQDAQEILGEVGEQPYRGLQRNLMGITLQIKGSLNEIEGALSAVSSVIIPRADMQKFIEDKEKRGYDTSMAVGGAGLLLAGTLATGGLGIPFLLPGLFMGLNTYFSSRDAEKLEQMRIENEYNRLDFYMNKAIDVFDHMMRTLMPYYVGEVNRAAFESFQLAAPTYQNALKDHRVREQLFKRMAQLYTFKQLPIGHSDIMKKEKIVQQIHHSQNQGMEFVSLINQEVKYVSESTPIPRIGSV